MKKMDIEKMETLQGGIKPSGWHLSVEQHVACALTGLLAGGASFGAGAAAGYLGCVALLY